MSQTDQPKPEATSAAREPFHWRRLLQYKLRTLLFVVIPVCSVFFAWWSYRAHQQRAAVAALEKCGASIRYDFQLNLLYDRDRHPHHWPRWLVDCLGVDYFGGVDEVVHQAGATDAELERISELPTLSVLSVRYAQISANGLNHLKSLTGLRSLSLYRSNLSDVDLGSLKYLHSLRSLDLMGTQVTDVGMQHINVLAGLEELNLAETKISDAGLKHLHGVVGLQRLYLDSTKITDASLEYLQHLTTLQELYVRNTQITDEGIIWLKKSLPNCTINHWRSRARSTP